MLVKSQTPYHNNYLFYDRRYLAISTGAFSIDDFMQVDDVYPLKYATYVQLLYRETVIGLHKIICDKRRTPFSNSLEFSSLVIGKVIGFSVRDKVDEAPMIRCITSAYFSNDNCYGKYKLTDLLADLACFCSKTNLYAHTELYNEMAIEAERISRLIIGDFSKKYPKDILSSGTYDRLYSYLLDVMSEAFRSKIEKAHEFLDKILEKPMVVNVGNFILTFDKIIHTMPLKWYDDDLKKAKKILLNLSILSFNKVFPLHVWQNDNKNAFQILIEPTFTYKFLAKKEGGNKAGFNLKEGVSVNFRFSISVDIENCMVKLIINPSAMSFIMKGRFYENSINSLYEIMRYVIRNIIYYERNPHYVIYFPIAV